MHITIFGAGAYGSALGKILVENNHQVTFYDPYEFPEISLERSLETSEILIIATPSTAIKNLLSSLPNQTHNLPMICASKGFLSLDPFYLFPNLFIIGGPTFALDLDKCHPTILTSSGELPIQLFSRPWLKIEQISDALGIMLCGSLKNIYAIESGYRNLTPTKKEFLAFISQTHNEMKKILEVNNCNPATADHACGLADLTMTCASNASRNYQYGQALAKDPHIRTSQTTEGFSAITNISQTPSFIIPKDAKILRNIIDKIQSI